MPGNVGKSFGRISHLHGGIAASVEKKGPDWEIWEKCKAFQLKHRHWPRSTGRVENEKVLFAFIAKLKRIASGTTGIYTVDERVMSEARRLGLFNRKKRS